MTYPSLAPSIRRSVLLMLSKSFDVGGNERTCISAGVQRATVSLKRNERHNECPIVSKESGIPLRSRDFGLDVRKSACKAISENTVYYTQVRRYSTSGRHPTRRIATKIASGRSARYVLARAQQVSGDTERGRAVHLRAGFSGIARAIRKFRG